MDARAGKLPVAPVASGRHPCGLVNGCFRVFGRGVVLPRWRRRGGWSGFRARRCGHPPATSMRVLMTLGLHRRRVGVEDWPGVVRGERGAVRGVARHGRGGGTSGNRGRCVPRGRQAGVASGSGGSLATLGSACSAFRMGERPAAFSERRCTCRGGGRCQRRSVVMRRRLVGPNGSRNGSRDLHVNWN